jgi:hypothetical protein
MVLSIIPLLVLGRRGFSHCFCCHRHWEHHWTCSKLSRAKCYGHLPKAWIYLRVLCGPCSYINLAASWISRKYVKENSKILWKILFLKLPKPCFFQGSSTRWSNLILGGLPEHSRPLYPRHLIKKLSCWIFMRFISHLWHEHFLLMPILYCIQ